MQTRTPRTLAAAAALALFAGACTDAPTAAEAPSPGRAGYTTSSTGAVLIPNSVKYRDKGGKPASGRSGNAVVQALALLDKEGTTTMSVTARHATDWWLDPYISRAQVKVSDAEGKHRFTRNFNGFDGAPPSWGGTLDRFPNDLQFQGLGRGDQIQVQANVHGADEQRTDVVTVTERVKRLPDLRVEMSAPGQVETGSPVNILAVVSETNGDMGTYATCELYVGGQLTDIAQGAWVDAGDAVTCAMAWSFSNPGTYSLEVRVSSAVREWDPGNNDAVATIQVNGESPAFYTSAIFEQTTQVDSSLQNQSWRDGSSGLAGESRTEEVSSSSHQLASMYAYMPAHLLGPLDVQTSMSTGSRTVTSFGFTLSGYGLEPACVAEYDGRAMLDFCTYTYQGGRTYVNYSLSAGAVTYHSRWYSRMYDQLTGTDVSVYHSNYEYGWDDGLVPLGDDWRFEVIVGTQGGDHVAAHTLRLERQPSSEVVKPYTCTTYDQTFWDYTSTICLGSSFRRESILGF